jgi:hypothetical protein
VAAVIGGYVTQRLQLSPIVGYLLAGIVVGPYTPGFVADRELAEQLAEIGVVLLMFGVGLQFHVEDLLAVRRVAVPGAIVQSTVATALGAAITMASWMGSLGRSSVRSGVVGGQHGRAVRDQVWDQVRDRVWDQVRDQVWDQVRDRVWDQVRDQVWDQVRDQVWDRVWDRVRLKPV